LFVICPISNCPILPKSINIQDASDLHILNASYGVFRPITSHLTFKDALHSSMCSGRLSWAYNHKPLLDNNHAVHTAAERNVGEHIHKLLKLENIDVQAAFEWAYEKDDLELVKRLLKDRRADPGKF
jgi:hypothetical protein